MACDLLAVDGANCPDVDGGTKLTFGADASQIEDITFDTDGQITTFTMVAPGAWKKFKFDLIDDTSYYNQEGERVGVKHLYNQSSLLKFAGINKDKVKAARALRKCCETVWIHFTNEFEIAMVQGIEWLGGQEWQLSKKPAKVTNKINTGTGAEESKVEFVVNSQAREESPLTTLSIEDVEAL